MKQQKDKKKNGLSSSLRAAIDAGARMPKPRRQPLLTEKDVLLLNKVIEVASKTMLQDLHLHYRDGSGWRARIGGRDASTWVVTDGPWTGLQEALNAAMKPVRAVLADNERRAAARNKPARRRKA